MTSLKHVRIIGGDIGNGGEGVIGEGWGLGKGSKQLGGIGEGEKGETVNRGVGARKGKW